MFLAMDLVKAKEIEQLLIIIRKNLGSKRR
jgi:hypothetical protein